MPRPNFLWRMIAASSLVLGASLSVSIAAASDPVELSHWQRDCQSMGYPEDYQGSVEGQTQIWRSKDLQHDLWLKNTCKPAGDEKKVADLVDAASPDKINLAHAEVPPPVPEMVKAEPTQTAPEPAQTAQEFAALQTPRFDMTESTTTEIYRAVPLPTALATPRLILPPVTHDPVPNAVNYAPAPPIRSAPPEPAPRAALGLISRDMAVIPIEAGATTPDERTLGKLEMIGQQLAAIPVGVITLTAYADMEGNGLDARGARRLSLARASAARDALLLGGAGSEQIRIRALGANSSGGPPDRIEISD
jgi:hypothetical protein